MLPLPDRLVLQAQQYPPRLRAHQLADVERIAFHVDLVRNRCGRTARVADIGGGVGMFSIGCALEGMNMTLIDDFHDDDHLLSAESPALHRHAAVGVNIIKRDITSGLELEPESFDAVTCFEALEHVHGGASLILRDMMTALRPGGLLVLSGPNAVNLRKRLMVPLGRSNWGAFDLWYISGSFRGHVHEFTAADFRAIAARLSLQEPCLMGRNWLAYQVNDSQARQGLMRGIDVALRARPQVCSTIYLLGTKARQ